MKQMFKRGSIAALVMAVSMAACFDDSPEQLVASARAALDKKNNAAAIIQLKNALQKNGNLAEARFLLGKALLASGDVKGADIELKKAGETGYVGDDLPVLRAQILLLNAKADQVIAEYAQVKLKSETSMAALHSIVAAAYGLGGRAADGLKTIELALALEPGNVHSQLVRIRLVSALQGIPAALGELEQILAKNPRHSEAWQIKGELLARSGAEPAATAAAFRESVRHDKSNVVSHTGLLSALFQQRDLAEAAKALDAFRAAVPQNPQVKLYATRYALERGELKTAHENVQALLKLAPDDPYILYLAGLTEFQRGALLQAESHLGKALTRMPNPTAVRLLLASTHLRAGEPAKVVAVLQPLLEAKPGNAQAFSMAAQALMQLGDLKAAEEYFAKAVQLNPKDTRSRTALAVAQIRKGQEAQGLEALQALSASDAGTMADLALISTFMRKSQWGNALKAIEALERKLPNKPLPASLRGQVELRLGNRPAARAAFEAALKADAVFYPAAVRLAELDVADKDIEAATKRFERILSVDPSHSQAHMAIVGLRRMAGATPAELAELLAKIIKLSPTAVAPRAALAGIYLELNDRKQALAVVQDGLAAFPDNPDLLEVHARVLEASGDRSQAAAAYVKLAALRPTSPEPQMRLAELYTRSGDRQAVKQSLKRALLIRPDFVPALSALFSIELAAGNLAEVRRMIAGLNKVPERQAMGALFEGDMEASQKNWSKAAQAYRSSWQKAPTLAAALKLHSSLMQSGKKAEAEAVEASWRKLYPKDGAFIFALADMALRQANYSVALTRYQEVLKLLPDHPAANNNVAWLLNSLKQPGALEYAKKAIRMQPNNPFFLDTEAAILADQGDTAGALSSQKRAVQLNPGLPMHRLRLAQYYVKAGHKEAARDELKHLTVLGDKFGAQAEVKKLLETL